jgi:hypothetical protein
MMDNARGFADRMHEQRQERIDNMRDFLMDRGVLRNNVSGDRFEKFLDVQRERIQQSPLFHRDSGSDQRPLFNRGNNNGLFRGDGWKGWGGTK